MRDFFKTACLLLLAALCASGCSKKAPEERIAIGVLLPLTGESLDEGFRALSGIQLAKREINESGGVLGKKLDIIVLNDKGDENYIAQQYNVLKERGIVAIIGSSYSKTTMALAEEAEKSGTLVISPTASNPNVTRGRKNVFRAIFTDDYQAKVMAKYARSSLKAETALVLHRRNDWGYKQLANFFSEAFAKQGGQVIALEQYSSEDEYRSILRKYEEAPPDAIYCPEDHAPAARFVDAVWELGLRNSYILGTDAWDGLLTYVNNSEVKKKIYYTTTFSYDDQDPIVEAFVRSYFTTFSQMPITGSANSYASVYILSEAIKKAGSANPVDIALAMKENEFNLVIGRVKFDENNNPRPNVYIIKSKDGAHTTYEKISDGGE